MKMEGRNNKIKMEGKKWQDGEEKIQDVGEKLQYGGEK